MNDPMRTEARTSNTVRTSDSSYLMMAMMMKTSAANSAVMLNRVTPAKSGL
jgi:hypothetical protein